VATERWSERTWTASGKWRYSNMKSSHFDGKVTRTYQYLPTPAEVRLDLQDKAVQENGQNAMVYEVFVCEVVTTHLFDA
jgi:hypothetical protein